MDGNVLLSEIPYEQINAFALRYGEDEIAELEDGVGTGDDGLFSPGDGDNPEFFGIRLENSCYKKDGKIHSFVKMGFESKLINYDLLTEQEQIWLKEFEVL